MCALAKTCVSLFKFSRWKKDLKNQISCLLRQKKMKRLVGDVKVENGGKLTFSYYFKGKTVSKSK